MTAAVPVDADPVGGPALVRVLLVDDHALVRATLAALLEETGDITVVGEAADGGEAVELARRVAPDVVLMDLSMPGVDGVTATRRLAEERCAARVLVLTSFGFGPPIRDALDAGAVGYLLKDGSPAKVVAGVRAAAAAPGPGRRPGPAPQGGPA